MKLSLERFVQAITEALKENLVSLILYGSQAGESFEIGKGSDYNVLMIVKNSFYEGLEKIDGRLLKRWQKDGNPPLLIFTEDEFIRSGDVFPIEYQDMTKNHRVLYGRDLLKDLRVEDRNLRHECEYELKTKLLMFRQQWLMHRNDKRLLTAILIGGISSILSLLRHVAPLFGEPIPNGKLDSLDILMRRCGLDPAMFRAIYAAKHGEKNEVRKNPEKMMKEYLIQIEKVISCIDVM